MKKVEIIFWCLIFLVSSCNTDSDIIEIIEGSHIETTDIANYLPENYKMDKSYVYFKNSAGDERKLFIRYGNPTASSSFNNSEKFTFEQQNVALFDLEANERVVQIFGDAGYDQNRRIVKLINCALTPLNPSGSCFLFINLKNGEVDFSHPNAYNKEKKYLDKSFKDVFVGISVQYKSYNEIAYNRYQGVVAYKDKNAEYWVFDRFDTK